LKFFLTNITVKQVPFTYEYKPGRYFAFFDKQRHSVYWLKPR